MLLDERRSEEEHVPRPRAHALPRSARVSGALLNVRLVLPRPRAHEDGVCGEEVEVGLPREEVEEGGEGDAVLCDLRQALLRRANPVVEERRLNLPCVCV